MALRQTPWRRDPAILARLPEVERRHLAGQPNTTIAAALNVSEGTIRNDLKHLSELWQEQIKGESAVLRGRIAAELRDVRRRAVKAAEFDEEAERAVLYGEGRAVERDAKGSAQFRGQKAQAINVARQASMDEAKLLGLVVEKQEVSGEGLVRIYERGSRDD